jgi:hypothetical protein
MGDFQAVIHKKHTKKFDIEETMAVALERMQNGFEPIGNRIDVWKGFELSDGDAKGIIYDAFIGDQLDAPEAPREGRAPLLFRPAVRRVQAPDFVEHPECLHIIFQGTRSDSPDASNGQTRRVL